MLLELLSRGASDIVNRRSRRYLVIGTAVDGAALHIPYPSSDRLLVATLVETGIAELLAAELSRQQISS